MVGHWVLVPGIGVRVPAPQQTKIVFLFRRFFDRISYMTKIKVLIKGYAKEINKEEFASAIK